MGQDFEQYARHTLREFFPDLSAATAKAAARRLETILAKRTPWIDTLTEEKWYELKKLLDELSTPGWRPTLGFFARIQDPVLDRQVYFKALTVRKRDIVRQYISVIDTLINDAKTPYAMRPNNHSRRDDDNWVMMPPVYQRERCDAVSHEAQDALLLCELALHAYHQEHGGSPATLGALVPEYLTAIPVDPFAKLGSLRYTLSKTGYLLYSVGPDGKDNGGKPSKDGQQKPPSERAHHVIREQSTGDVVAGVNVQ